MEILRFALNDPADYALPPVLLEPELWRNGAVVRMPNHLGDAVMALPALQAVSRILPEHCGLFVVAPEMFRQFYAALPFVGCFIGLRKAHANWSLNEIREVKRLRAGVGIFFNNSPRDVIAMRLARVPQLYGAAGRGRSFLLTKAFSLKRQQIPGCRAGEHLCSRYLAIVMALGAPAWDGVSLPEFKFIRGGDESKQHIWSWCEHPQMLLLGPGAAYGDAKCYGSADYNAIARWWIDNGGVVVVTGGKSEVATGEEVCAGLPREKCVNLCGKTDLQELMMLIRFSRFMICNDSGIMHLGAALDKPGIAVFGSTDPTATGPISAKWQCISERTACSPCFRHVCPYGHKECMKKVNAEDIIRLLKNMF
jgi:heptosyltransferase-2